MFGRYYFLDSYVTNAEIDGIPCTIVGIEIHEQCPC
jgi:hypothetical protein